MDYSLLLAIETLQTRPVSNALIHKIGVDKKTPNASILVSATKNTSLLIPGEAFKERKKQNRISLNPD